MSRYKKLKLIAFSNRTAQEKTNLLKQELNNLDNQEQQMKEFIKNLEAGKLTEKQKRAVKEMFNELHKEYE